MAKRLAIPAMALTLIASVIAIEGGYVNHPSDPGGETNMGITKRIAVKHGYGGPMRTLPRSVAESIYYQSYLVKPGFAPLVHTDAAVTEELFEESVNMGPHWPSLWLQQSLDELGVKVIVDGHVGLQTIAAYSALQAVDGNATACVEMLDKLDGKQKARYDYLVRVNPRNLAFYKGWVAKRIGNVDRTKCRAGS
jgi:lysozyme family protein